MTVVLINPHVFRDRPGPHLDMLKDEGFEIRYPENPNIEDASGTDEATIADLQGVSAVIAGGERYNRRVLSESPDLRAVARAGVGFDRVDVAAATDLGIAVTITPSAIIGAVAEQALALLLTVAKSTVVNDRLVRDGQWPKTIPRGVRGHTLGIVGLGRTGRGVAVRALALEMKVIAVETVPDHEFVKQHGIELVELDTLLARSDYVSLNCPLNDQTRDMFNRELFDKMKPDSVLINTSRGGVVVESDLVDALQSGHLRGAGLDVFASEPPEADNPLLKMDNVVAASHRGGLDHISAQEMAIEAAENIVLLKRGQWPDSSALNSQLKTSWQWDR